MMSDVEAKRRRLEELRRKRDAYLISKKPAKIELEEPIGVLTPEGAKRARYEEFLRRKSGIPGDPGTGFATLAGMSRGGARATGVSERIAAAITPGETQENLERLHAAQELSRRYHPKAFGRAEFGTQMGVQALPDIAAGTSPMTLAGKTARGALAGGLYGASLQSKSPADIAKNVAIHGVAGAGTAALMHPIGMGLGYAGKKIAGTKAGQAVSAKTKSVLQKIADKLGRKAEISAFRSTKPSPAELGKLRRMPGGRPFITETGEAITDQKQAMLGRTMIDEGILDVDKGVLTSLNSPKKMRDKAYVKLLYWGKKKGQLLKEHGEKPLFNKTQLANELDSTIGEEMLQNAQGDKTMMRIYNQFKRHVDALREMPSDETGNVTWSQAEGKLRAWGNAFYDKNHALKDQFTGADEVRLALKRKIESSLGELGEDVAQANSKYHNLKIITDYVNRLADKGESHGLEKLIGATGLGVTGMMYAAGQDPKIAAAATGVVGLNLFRRKYGDQMQARFWENLSRKLRQSGEQKFYNVIRSKIDNPRSAILAHSYMYKNNPKYREIIKSINKGETDKPKPGEKKPYDSIAPGGTYSSL